MDYGTTLIQTGLTKDQSSVYEVLIKHGTMPASRIPRLTPISRPLAYKVLQELIILGLVEKQEEKGAVARFSPAHPLKLKELIEKKRLDAEDAKIALDGVLGKLLSDFNLTSGKPGVQFFEGNEGIRAILDDILTSKTEVCAYIDIAAVETELADVNTHFGLMRKKLGIKKKNIAIDTPENRKLVHQGYMGEFTEERLIPWSTPAFGTTIQIYDNKISYRTSATKKIGIIITDPHIYLMHKQLFEFVWNSPLAYIPKDHGMPLRTDADASNAA